MVRKQKRLHMMLVWHQDGKCNSELDIFSK
jgi:hypothetical protein